MTRCSAVIFDFDGIVLDSETPEYESHRRIYERCGVALTVDEWCGVIGTWSEGHDEQWFARLCERSTVAPTREDYFAERRRIFDEIVPADPATTNRTTFLVLYDGRIHFSGSADELLASTEPYLKELLYRTLPPW